MVFFSESDVMIGCQKWTSHEQGDTKQESVRTRIVSVWLNYWKWKWPINDSNILSLFEHAIYSSNSKRDVTIMLTRAHSQNFEIKNDAARISMKIWLIDRIFEK